MDVSTTYGYPDLNGNDSNGNPCTNVTPPSSYPAGTGTCQDGYVVANYDPNATINDQSSCCTNKAGGDTATWQGSMYAIPDCI